MDAVCNFVGQPRAAFAEICFFKKADFRFFRLVGCRVRQKPGQRVRVFPVSAPYQIKQLFAANPAFPSCRRSWTLFSNSDSAVSFFGNTISPRSDKNKRFTRFSSTANNSVSPILLLLKISWSRFFFFVIVGFDGEEAFQPGNVRIAVVFQMAHSAFKIAYVRNADFI